ncbi:MAG: hypothetical protein A3C08_00420 [Candidatus Taylorbacteria bacterium RIFCSPHIGHO2_02_FULL_47_18]|uniref:DUF5667 domain-containing protein n=1 Tax=Candidatus Taylorbacteria bacterium RIFCSPLOWO2_01_FULL_48_100 TaxID=1802322 RepID=A0A1G2NCW5_9BACT|nr:MAG: hypothetical protein A2670_00135 [Candidatus Taylorbacteria bacterium RIFCSPHIGHO2_01_FULL_48_38]OHA27825.1 MAG: hypothetical protein A3C08_00420 [Candidatus Taylorbacteria bacterium RIFCSPHIGHO2_02_FULL_47_18]OHA33937.1 MAG: hypothetical protein A2938_02860 [Candidatus Taylorbacteria bacterium RIFCSPLOWO2_01_FULL_48_100]OHA40911.1 MAG: hypothetical protein A3J31_03865 [Candidatus Taylorbacteria bacterium RIFCSPLOWO2_02_FULL_48_16]OHA45078.1 MAG: hypothetical protein A3H13_02710 [Candid
MQNVKTILPFQAAAVAGLLFVAGLAFAQDAAQATTDSAQTTAAPVETQAAPTTAKPTTGIRAKVQTLKERVAGKKDEVKTERKAVKEKISALKKTQLQNVVRKLEARAKTIDALLVRTESRIAKLATQGTNTDLSTSLVATAKVKIADAKTAIEEVKAKAQTAAETATKESIAQVTTAARNAEAKIKSAHAALVDAVNSLKPGRNAVKPK